MRNFQPRIGRHDRGDIAADPAEAGRRFIFEAPRGHELHADADAEKGPALLHDGLVQRVDHAGNGIEAAATVGEGADAGQDDAVGLATSSGSPVTLISLATPASRAARSKALRAEWRLPEP